MSRDSCSAGGYCSSTARSCLATILESWTTWYCTNWCSRCSSGGSAVTRSLIRNSNRNGSMTSACLCSDLMYSVTTATKYSTGSACLESWSLERTCSRICVWSTRVCRSRPPPEEMPSGPTCRSSEAPRPSPAAAPAAPAAEDTAPAPPPKSPEESGGASACLAAAASVPCRYPAPPGRAPAAAPAPPRAPDRGADDSDAKNMSVGGVSGSQNHHRACFLFEVSSTTLFRLAENAALRMLNKRETVLIDS
mmetsp:Transcript_30704/g.70780  ORF Transcript_30704/g.70780 Transcript_30704/m.70780 type:complete len:250 (-) Transcript_30704:1195-1944(-)